MVNKSVTAAHANLLENYLKKKVNSDKKQSCPNLSNSTIGTIVNYIIIYGWLYSQ